MDRRYRKLFQKSVNIERNFGKHLRECVRLDGSRKAPHESKVEGLVGVCYFIRRQLRLTPALDIRP